MNRGSWKLRRALDAKGHGSYGLFAEEIGAELTMVSKWLSDRHKPSLPYRLKIQEAHGIPITDWDEQVVESEPQPAPQPSESGEHGAVDAPLATGTDSEDR